MTYEDALAAHVREFYRLNARLREVLLTPNYDNDDSPEVRDLKRDIASGISDTFLLKQCHSNAVGIMEREGKIASASGKPAELTVQGAMDRISTALKSEHGPGSYRDSWLANIAIPIYDQRGKLDLTDPKDANAMAEILLKHLFGV